MNLLEVYAGKRKLSTKTLYICVDIDGYVLPSLSNIAVLQALSIFKQLVHLGISINVFREGSDLFSTWGLLSGIGQKYDLHAIVMNHNNQDNILGSALLHRDVAGYISKIEFNHDYTSTVKAGCESVTACLSSSFSTFDKVFNTEYEGDDIAAIRTAIEWAFDSNSNDNDTVAFIQVCIGLEALLGEGVGQEPLTDTLADRCAYLLGNSLKSRKDIKRNFKELYRLRSNLVHGRVPRLKQNESGFLRWGKDILDAVIHKELKYLK